MTKCKQCGKDYKANGRSLYCSNSCKQEFYRNRMNNVTKESVTIRTKSVTIGANVTNPCKYCGKQLNFTVLECCYDCALKQPSKSASPAKDGHTLSSRPVIEFTGKLTVTERLFYHPVSELRKGETNFVSLPGRACYGVY